MKYIIRLLAILVILWLGFYINSLLSRSDLEKKLAANFQSNTFVKIDSLIGEKEGMVCVIGEYAYRLPDINNDMARINTYIKKIHFTNGESETALTIVTKDKIQLYKFDNVSWNIKLAVDAREQKRVDLPTNFEPAKQCIALKDAYFYQTIVKYESLYSFTSKNGVQYIILGSKRQ